MLHKIKKQYYTAGAAWTMGLVMAAEAQANTFNDITSNVQESISDLPGMLTGLAFMFGLLLFALGVMKIKDHVENPTQTPLKDGAIRLLAGGALFAIPIVTEAMRETIGSNGDVINSADVNSIDFDVQ